MSRPNRKHTRAIERHRRNKGPALLSRVADDKIEKNATTFVEALFTATTKDRNASAASLLVGLAETAEWIENPAAVERALSLAEQWAREPQVVMLDTDPQLNAPPKQPQLTAGSAGTTADSSSASNPISDSNPAPTEIVEAIYEESPAEEPPADPQNLRAPSHGQSHRP